MNTNEQRIREFAYQIWESEGKPHGHTERHWEMASKLAHVHAASELQQTASTEPAPSIEPIVPISPTQPAQPVPPSDPIQPTDPVQPGQPVQSDASVTQAEQPAEKPAKPKRLRAKPAAAVPTNTELNATAADATVAPKKSGRLKKSKSYENESV